MTETLDAEKMRNSVRPGDVVVVAGEQFDLEADVPVAAVYPEGESDVFTGVSYGPDGVGDLVKVNWGAIEAYHPNEKTDHPSIIASRLVDDQEENDDQEEA